MNHILNDKPSKIFLGIACFFVANALIAECIGGKIFMLEQLIHLPLPHFSLLGETNLSFNLTCGVLLWPLEFVLTDVVNEYYGPKAVRRISYLAIALIAYAFLMFYISMHTTPPEWWIHAKADQGIPDLQAAYQGVFGQSMWIIVGSLVAFSVSQILDVTIFHWIKKKTGEKQVWLRATGSTLVSQLIDSFIVLFIAFKIGNNWSINKVIAIGLVNYSYKALVAIALTPVIYGLEKLIENYVGHAQAKAMKHWAMGKARS